jgi:formylglycine-generating enzyme required for sulfatase activity
LLDTGGSGGAGDSGGTDGSAGIDSGETGGSAEIDSGIDSGGSGAGGTGGFDAGCASETDAAFCARLFKNCGSVTANDTCGASRTVSWCGTCSPPQTCGGSNICGEYVPSSPSCSGGLTCSGESCCTSIVVPGGTFLQGRSTVENASDFSPGGASDEVPEFSSTVSSFALDKYEVTVGRFREFVDAYVSNTTSAPADGAGANPAVPGSGWQSAWGASLPATQAAFKSPSHLSCSTSNQTWTNNVGANEDKAINCVDWFEAFAFCIWDGGRLPTEAEWEYTAAGGADNRLYPWGLAAPDCRYANYKNGAYLCSGSVVDVGSAPIGNGRWGHADLGGNVWEWTLDWYATYPASARTDYANIVTGFSRVVRGGVFDTVALNLRSACRGTVSGRDVGRVGVRCARSAP